MHEKSFKRTDRVVDLLRKIIAEVFAKKIHHHGFDQVTITDVSVTPDLKRAHVYYRLLDPTKRQEMMKAIQTQGRNIQREVAAQVKLRSTPHLVFQYDEALDYGNKIEQLFAHIHSTDEVAPIDETDTSEEE